MHRQPLLTLLARYAEAHPAEQETVTRFTRFVTEQPHCFERSLAIGHITGSAWILNAAGTHVLLTHHRKLGCWLQLGGHADGDPDTLAVALREAQEESGIDRIAVADPEIFDLDIHRIPARKEDPEHLHYDVRYLLRTAVQDFVVSEESHDLQWVPLGEVASLSTDSSMLRMAAKSLAFPLAPGGS